MLPSDGAAVSPPSDWCGRIPTSDGAADLGPQAGRRAATAFQIHRKITAPSVATMIE